MPNDDAVYHTILEQSPEAMIWADRQGIIRFWNRSAEELFGYPVAEAMEQRMDLIIPENLRYRHWEGNDRVMVNGEPSHYGRHEMLKIPALRKDGSRASVEFTLQSVEHPEYGLIAVAELRDLRKRLAEAEARIGDPPAPSA